LKKLRFISGLAFVGVVAALVLFVVWSNRGPRYEGKSPRYWVGQLVRRNTAARPALLALGPAAAPALANAVRARQSWLEKKLASFRPRLPKWMARRVLSPFEARVRQQYALEVLEELGPSAAPAIPALLDLDSRGSDEFLIYSVSAQRVMLSIGEAGLPELIRVLDRGKEPAARARAAVYLGLLGAKAAPASLALAKALHDSNPIVRKEAVGALAQIGPAAAAALPALQAALKLDNDEFRLQVVEALWDIGHNSELTVPVLVKVLRDPQHPSRARAATILARMGPAAKAAAPVLKAVTQEEFSYTRVKAEEALREIGSGPPAPAIGQLE
jgi:hypothetical protein